MPSNSPPLPSASTVSVPWVSPVAGGSSSSGWINWPPILASASLSFALVVSIVAWIVTHPSKRPGTTESLPFAALATGEQSLPRHTVERIVEPPASLPDPEMETIPVVYRPHRPVKSDHRILLIEETPPLLPPPVSAESRCDPPPAAVQAAPPQPAGETYGTQVMFLSNQQAAAELAKRDRKLLFVMHISGNFEDSCFT